MLLYVTIIISLSLSYIIYIICPKSLVGLVWYIYLTELQSIYLHYNNYKQPQLQDPWNEPLALKKEIREANQSRRKKDYTGRIYKLFNCTIDNMGPYPALRKKTYPGSARPENWIRIQPPKT